MRIGLIGIGQAGGKIADKLLEYDDFINAGFIRGCLAINTARQDLAGLEYIPESKRMLIGEGQVKGNGVGADNKKGRDIMEENFREVQDKINEIPLHEIDAFLVTAALGGGTGSGGMPVLTSKLQEYYEEPVYGLGVLPSKSEGDIYTLNAARSLESCINSTDNLLLFDNEAWSRGSNSIEEWYTELNRIIAKRFGLMFASGEITDKDNVGESVVDASEVINTLECGGITAIGQKTDELDNKIVNPGLLSRLRGKTEIDTTDATIRMKSLSQQAISGQLTIPADIESTERALVVFSGPPKFMSRKGVEEGRSVIETRTNCMEVRGGDYPRPNTPEMAATVILSGLYKIPRIKELQEIAIEANNKIEKVREEREDKLEKLLREEDTDKIDSLLDI